MQRNHTGILGKLVPPLTETWLDFPAGKISFYCEFEGGMRLTVRVVSLRGGQGREHFER